MIQVSRHAWHNGTIREREAGSPSIASLSLHLGTGVFDGMMAYWNRDHYHLHHGEDHLVRFRHGSARMGLVVPWSVEDLLRGIEELLQLEPIGTQYVRPIAYRRGPELWVTGDEGRPVDVSIFTVRADRDVDKLIRCQISPVERISSRSIPGQIKVSGAYVNSFHSRKTAEIAGFDDALMFDREGRFAEASAANMFVVAEGRLLTPPLNCDVFPGITRSVVIKLATDCNIKCDEMDLRESDLRDVDAAFLCSTLMELRGISHIQHRAMGTEDNEIFKTILREFRAYVHR